MGLDMYLKANKYVAGYDFYGDEAVSDYQEIVDKYFPFAAKDSPSVNLAATVVYWRKANAIHAWFVKHAQDGVDECQEVEVGRDMLHELLTSCIQVLGTATIAGKPALDLTLKEVYDLEDGAEALLDTELASELLPPQSGFFFGSTDYSIWYLTDLIHTKESLQALLEAYPSYTHMTDPYFTYQSSW